MTENNQPNLHPDMKTLSEHLRTGSIKLNDDNIVLVEIDSHDRKTVDQWIEFSENIRRNWSVDKPLFILVDMSKNDFSFGAYANRRAANMMAINPELPTYIAWVVRKSLISNLLQATLNAANMTSRAARFMVIHSREEGFEWLNKTYDNDVDKKLAS